MRRTFKYRAYPNRAQTEALDAQLGEACYLYNAALQERRDAWKMQRWAISHYDQVAQLTTIRAAGNLDIPNFSVSQDVLRRVDRAFSEFFARVKAGRKAGYPRFRSRRRYDSLTFPLYRHGCRLHPNGRLYLQGIGDVKVKLHRPVEGRIKTVSVKRQAGNWYVMFSCEVEPSPLPASSEAAGIDVGLITFAVLSDGSEIANPRYERQSAAALRRAHRKVARRKRGSNGRRKAIVLLQKTHAHIAQQRNDFHHKTARALVNRFGLIAVEDLNLQGLANSMLARSVQDAGWGRFLARLDEKAASAARQIVRVNPSGTTQRCSGCQKHVPKTLSQRWHDCPACGLSLSRDENAAREILRLGLSHAEQTWPGSASVSAEVHQGHFTDPYGAHHWEEESIEA